MKDVSEDTIPAPTESASANRNTIGKNPVSSPAEPPAMGERRARWGLGYQDKVVTTRILEILRNELHVGTSAFEGVRLADLKAGRADDFVLVWNSEVQGNSIKWSGTASPINWGELLGADGLLKSLVGGYSALSERWPQKRVTVRLQSNRPAAIEKHRKQLITSFSVAEFLRNHWSSGPTDADPASLSAAWGKIGKHLGLKHKQLIQFVQSCELILGFPEPWFNSLDSYDLRHYRKQFDDLHKAIATWITNNPSADFIERQFLLEAIGFRESYSGLVQRFPLPQIPYQRNSLSAKNLRDLIDSVAGGYIAVTGPAGVGKSTLVQDVLSDCPFFIPYYAYLPDGEGNPRDRGEALTFFQDVVPRLDRFFQHRHSLGIADVAQGREALRQHMKKAHELFLDKGNKTVLLIDGLDHVMREFGLQQSILMELPRPDEVPEGFLIILSSQPQALLPATIERHVATVIEPSSRRRINVEGLTRQEVHGIIEKARRQTSSSERDLLFDSCQGNPLILTYLLQLFDSKPHASVADAISAAGNYGGDMETYYQSALAVPLRDTETRHLLGLLSRAAPMIPTTWLQSWSERMQLESLYENVLAPFIRTQDEHLRFIHNSLIAFLKSETRSRLPGANFEEDERAFHSILADRCGNAACVDPLGRAKVFHLLRSGRDRELLSVLSSEWLRAGLEAFLPYSEIYPLILLGLAAAWKLNEYGEVLRLILLDFELGQRAGRMKPLDLASKFLELDRPALAISQIRSASRILVDDEDALKFANDLWAYATRHNRQELKNLSRNLYLQAKPLNFIYHNEPIDLFRHESREVLNAWAAVAPLFETPEEIVSQIKKLRFSNSRPQEETTSTRKASLIFMAFLTFADAGFGANAYQPFIKELTKLKHSVYLFQSLRILCRNNPSVRLLNRLKNLRRKIQPNLDVDLSLAEILYERGYADEARDIISGLHHIRFDYFQNRHVLGLSDVWYTIELRRLQELLALEEGPMPGVEDNHEEGYARIEMAARSLGELFAKVESGKPIQDLRERFRAILLFHNLPVAFPDYDWHQNYSVTQSKPAIYRQLINLAARIGKSALETLSSEFREIIQGPAGRQFSPEHRHMFAKAFFWTGIPGKDEALTIGMSSTTDGDDDPAQRQEACLNIAEFLHEIGQDDSVEEWVNKASKVSAGAGSHKDYHMAQLAQWLTESIGTTLNHRKLDVLEKFLRGIEVAGGAGQDEAAKHLLKSIFKVDPFRTVSLAIDLIDREILNVSQTLESLIVGAADAGASPSLLLAVYSEMLSLVHPAEISDAAVRTVQAFPPTERISAAESLMASVRTNSLPSQRIGVARALQDSLREDGLGEMILNRGLDGATHHSSKYSLYKLSTGELLTAGQMAGRLSVADRQCEWNPNPSENKEFDWWPVIEKTKTRDLNHLNELVSTFPLPDYRQVDLLLWKSERLLTMDDREGAKDALKEAAGHARTSSWLRWLDGAQQRKIYASMKRFDANTSIRMAHEKFGADLSSGKIYTTYLLDDIVETFGVLEIEWPSNAVLDLIGNYLEGVLSVNRTVPVFSSLVESSVPISPDQAMCRFLLRFLSFPVVAVGVAARRALTRYATESGSGLVDLLITDSWDSVQLEHLLVCVHMGLRANSKSSFRALQKQILELNQHDSIAVRAIARRICVEEVWQWQEITDLPPRSPVLVTLRGHRPVSDYDEARMLVDRDLTIALRLFQHVIELLEDAGNDAEELRSEFLSIYSEIENGYSWKDEQRLNLWIQLTLARFWLKPRAILGREAAMRLVGRRALSGQAPAGIEPSYDFLDPIYDPDLELLRPSERPLQLKAMQWGFQSDENKQWLEGKNAANWTDYPTSIQGLHIIGERTLFIRPDWEWPREERYRGLFDGSAEPASDRGSLASQRALTYTTYLKGVGQPERQLVVSNSERYGDFTNWRWVALNSRLAKSLGWVPSPGQPFEWLDTSGRLMVKCLYWRDGWTGLEPPRSESLGEGWLVLATTDGLNQIRYKRPAAQCHLWVERHSHGDKPYKGSWHLTTPISALESRP